MKLLKEPGSMETPFIPANVLSVMLKASSILKPVEVKKKENIKKGEGRKNAL